MRLAAGRTYSQLDNLIIAYIVAVFIIVAVAVDEVELMILVVEIPNLILIVIMEAALGANPQAVVVANHIVIVIAAAGARLAHSVVRFIPSPYNVILNIVLHFLLCPIVYYC